jgi:hypothetical protein
MVPVIHTIFGSCYSAEHAFGPAVCASTYENSICCLGPILLLLVKQQAVSFWQDLAPKASRVHAEKEKKKIHWH